MGIFSNIPFGLHSCLRGNFFVLLVFATSYRSAKICGFFLRDLRETKPDNERLVM